MSRFNNDDKYVLEQVFLTDELDRYNWDYLGNLEHLRKAVCTYYGRLRYDEKLANSCTNELISKLASMSDKQRENNIGRVHFKQIQYRARKAA
jgi:hypothetical protein